MYVSSDIAELALEYAGVKSVYDVTASPEQLARALQYFNLILAEKTGTKKIWWWVPDDQVIPLTANTTTYNLTNLLTATGKSPLMIVFNAALKNNTTGKLTPLELIRRNEFTEIYAPTVELGTPTQVYVSKPTDGGAIAYLMPTLTDTTNSYSLVLTGLKPPLDIRDDGGDTALPFPAAWARCFALLTALDIGMGPVVALSPARRAELRGEAEKAWVALNSFNNQANTQPARFTRPRSF
jgi:hypothetical protein